MTTAAPPAPSIFSMSIQALGWRVKAFAVMMIGAPAPELAISRPRDSTKTLRSNVQPTVGISQ